MTEPKLLLWATHADDGPGVLAVGDSGNRYSVRQVGGSRNGSRVLRVNGALVRRFESIREAKEYADRIEAERLAKKRNPLPSDDIIRVAKLVDRALIRDAIRRDPELSEAVKRIMAQFWKRFDEREKAEKAKDATKANDV